MLNFESDYIHGAHPKILEKLIETNLVPQSGYANDEYTLSATEKIREAAGDPDADIVYISGGTQSNMIVIDTMLRRYEGVVAATSGHISAHEGGAIEFTGHKVMTLPEHDGKIDPAELKAFISGFYADGNHTHMVYPGIVYITYPTETGTLYSLAEMEEISAICRSYKIPLFLDGARLGYGLMSKASDVTLKDINRLCDVYYIGGTKVGALCGEAVVWPRHGLPSHFVTMLKQHGGLLAKGRLCGVQFDALFTDNLYFDIAKHAMDMAEKMKEIFTKKGYTFFRQSPTNQQFILLEDSEMEKLAEKVKFTFWEKADETHTAVRFVTCWATTEEDLAELEKVL